MRSISYLLLFTIINSSLACISTRPTKKPIVCPECEAAMVELIQPQDGEPITRLVPEWTIVADKNGCKTMARIDCNPQAGGTVIMQFQDQAGGLIEAQSVDLICDKDKYYYTEGATGFLHVTSVECFEF